MERYWVFLFLMITMSAWNHLYGQIREHKKPRVLLDPGHGGTDSGAIGINGLKEKDITLNIAKDVIRLNRSLYSDTLEIYLTRYKDTLIALGHRTKLAKALEVDVFISIHCNQAQRKAAQGIEVYLHYDNDRSVPLAQELATGLNHKLGFKNRGVKQANFQVLRETEGLCPSLLLELGFLSNREEGRHNSKRTSITAYALLILETLIEHSHD